VDDRRSTTNYDVYAQRINSAGVVQWAANGIVVSNATADQVWPMIAADGSGGAVIAWYDNPEQRGEPAGCLCAAHQQRGNCAVDGQRRGTERLSG
jgi:hypothetical protein